MKVQKFVAAIDRADRQNCIVYAERLNKIDRPFTESRGIIAGVGAACIAIVADRLINQWAQKKRMEFGLQS